MNKINYTITGKTDGFGAQYQAIMSGIAYCKFKNYNYIHTPLLRLSRQHTYNIKSLNNFIGIPYIKCYNDINIDIKETFSRIVNYSKNPSNYYTNDVVSTLREYYYSTLKPELENIDIAIHIRRGDVTNKMKQRYTNNTYYNKIIKFLNNKYPDYNIIIFSEGKIEDFNELNGNNISFKLDTSLEETFHSMVSAKILVTAKSSFSYCAAILNTNKIYYIDFAHKPLNHWDRISNFVK